MNSIELAYKLGRISMDSSSSSVPPPPASLSSSSSMSSSLPYELDCTGFEGMSPSPSSASSSYGSLSSQEEPQGYESQSSLSRGMSKGWGSTLSRSRCVHNLASLGSTCSESSTSTRQVPPYGTGLNEGWGHFVDSRSR
mmetsp:Transcript_12032/g.21413  ORF Transcript_12032/g.21413 Transcript_12032/m.21413 type:complete len:139 (-) Transcript_12032:260-676(-)